MSGWSNRVSARTANQRDIRGALVEFLQSSGRSPANTLRCCARFGLGSNRVSRAAACRLRPKKIIPNDRCGH